MSTHDECPGEDCGCGIYGQFNIITSFENIVASFAYFTMVPAVELHSLPFIVLTEHYGKTLVHERGIRSEFAKVVGAISFREDLVTFERYRDLARKAADVLGVPMFGLKAGQLLIDNSLAVNGL
jgi:hypothetical protein